MILRLDFPKVTASKVACAFQILRIVILTLTQILMNMSKKTILKGVFTIIKYVATLVLGYLGGSNADVISNIM